jgi:hypothetical protein
MIAKLNKPRTTRATMVELFASELSAGGNGGSRLTPNAQVAAGIAAAIKSGHGAYSMSDPVGRQKYFGQTCDFIAVAHDSFGEPTAGYFICSDNVSESIE